MHSTYKLVPRCFKHRINKVKKRTHLDAAKTATIILKLNLKAKWCSNVPIIFLDLDKLQRSSVVEVFKATAEGKFDALNLVDCNVDIVSDIKEVLLSTAKEVLVSQMKKKRTMGHK